MKILGVMLTWNNLEYLKCSLKQALDFCDELIVVEGCHFNKYPKRSTDGSYEYLQNFNHPKLIIRDFNFKGRNDFVQWKIRKTCSEESELWEPGNWICQWDDDIAFFNDDLKKIKECMKKTKKDMIRFVTRRFNYNFKINFYNGKPHAYHFDRITERCYYKPNWKMIYKDGKHYKKFKFLKDVVYFHYTYVKPPSRIRARFEMSVEKGYVESKDRFNRFMEIQYNKDEDILKYKKDMEFINATYGLNVYRGIHPEIMENHPWKDIKDCREL